MPWTIGDVPEGVEKLSSPAQAAWVKTANEAIEEGYDDGAAIAIAWTVAKKIDADEYSTPAVIMNYPAWRPGKYNAAMGGEFEVTPSDVSDMAEAINRLYELGHPIALIEGHGSSYAMGTMPCARVDEDDVLRSALVTDWYVADGIRQGTSGLSVEANRDYTSDAYTDGKTFRYWPTAWAVLPAGEQPAVPPGEPIAAKDKDKPVRLYAHETAPDRGELPHGKEAEQMEELKQELEQLKAAQEETAGKVSALETERDELKAKLEAAEQERDKLAKEKADAELAAAEAEITERSERILAAAVPGTREKMQKRLEAAEGMEARKVLLDAWEPLMDEKALESARLKASEAKPNEKKGDTTDDIIQAAEKMSRETGKPISECYGLIGKE